MLIVFITWGPNLRPQKNKHTFFWVSLAFLYGTDEFFFRRDRRAVVEVNTSCRCWIIFYPKNSHYSGYLCCFVFHQGIFYNNMRWGPGIESNTNLQENVGLWRGNQLIRVTWRPNTPSVCLDFNFGPDAAKTLVEAHRTIFSTSVRDVRLTI